MQKQTFKISLFLITALCSTAAVQFTFAVENPNVTGNVPGKKAVNWEAFSDNLVKALNSENQGIRYSAMQLIIEHGDKLDVDANTAVFPVMRIFRHSDNQKARQLALTALTRMNNEWAMGFLKREIKFETNPVIQKQLRNIFLNQ